MIKRLLLIVALSPLFVGANVNNFVPQPQKVVVQNGVSTFTDGSTVGYSRQELKAAAEYAADALSGVTGVKFRAVKGAGSITLRLNKSAKVEGAYSLTVKGNKASIAGDGYNGVINGIATLLQMFDPATNTIENATITDCPAYQWRGMHIDVSRHFLTVDEVKRVIDVIASYKFNKLH